MAYLMGRPKEKIGLSKGNRHMSTNVKEILYRPSQKLPT